MIENEIIEVDGQEHKVEVLSYYDAILEIADVARQIVYIRYDNLDMDKGEIWLQIKMEHIAFKQYLNDEITLSKASCAEASSPDLNSKASSVFMCSRVYDNYKKMNIIKELRPDEFELFY